MWQRARKWGEICRSFAGLERWIPRWRRGFQPGYGGWLNVGKRIQVGCLQKRRSLRAAIAWNGRMVTAYSAAIGRAWLAILAAGGLLLNISAANAAGLFLDGADARSMALGGEEAAQTGSAIAAMDSNPAALSG